MNWLAIFRVIEREGNFFLGAIIFLTRIPVGKFHVFQLDSVARAATYFPLVGMLVGGAGALVAMIASQFYPPAIVAVLCMLTTVLITGGLHEDGLSDAADGLVGGQNPTRRLEIMQDSRIGTFGALALWFSLTAKFIFLQSLLTKGILLAGCALMVANTLGRGATVVLLHFCKYVRTEPSKSKPFGDNVTSQSLRLALGISAAIAILFLGSRGIVCVCAAAIVTWAAKTYFQHKIGGVTGDCLGASNQLVELACYLVLLH